MEAVSIRLDNISKSFQHRVKGRVVAVNRVNLMVHPGELLTFLGPSGCGKTTTLRMVAGFEKPEHGRIFIDQTTWGKRSNTAWRSTDTPSMPRLTTPSTARHLPSVRRLASVLLKTA